MTCRSPSPRSCATAPLARRPRGRDRGGRTPWWPAEHQPVSYEQIAVGAAQLAHALRGLGIDGDDRVGPYLWNNREHLEAYLAVPAMGAVLHTANIRLFADELVQTVNLAQDRVLLADADLMPALAPGLGRMAAVRAVVVRGQPAPDYGAVDGVAVYRYDDLVRSQPGEFAWPDLDGAPPPRSASPRAPPASPRASPTATGRSTCTRCRCAPRTRSRSAPATAG